MSLFDGPADVDSLGAAHSSTVPIRHLSQESTLSRSRRQVRGVVHVLAHRVVHDVAHKVAVERVGRDGPAEAVVFLRSKVAGRRLAERKVLGLPRVKPGLVFQDGLTLDVVIANASHDPVAVIASASIRLRQNGERASHAVRVAPPFAIRGFVDVRAVERLHDDGCVRRDRRILRQAVRNDLVGHRREVARVVWIGRRARHESAEAVIFDVRWLPVGAGRIRNGF